MRIDRSINKIWRMEYTFIGSDLPKIVHSAGLRGAAENEMDSVTFQVLNKRSIKLCSGHCCSLMDKKPSIRVSKIGEPESEGLPVHPLQPPFIPLLFEEGSPKILLHL